MSDDRTTRAEALYHAALARPEAERESFLRDACGADEVLRAEARSLLRLHREANRLLAEPVAAAETLPFHELRAGDRLGGYEVVGLLGRGGMGVVYRALDPKLGREVALKRLPEDVASDPDRRSRLDREARALAALSHSGVASIYGIEESDGVLFLVLELVEGETLAARLSRGPPPVPEALRLCLQIAEALGAAHERDVLHRDLKPSNVAVTPDGKIKLLDFGLAKALGPEPPGPEAGGHPATEAGAVLGTPGYMSPEQARGERLDRRSDVWSFGCVLYETLTGSRAFPGETAADALAAALEREPDWARLPEETPDGVRALLRRCLRRDASRRLRDLADVAIEIEDALAAERPVGAPGRSSDPGRRVWPWAIAGGLAAAIGLVLALVVPRPAPSPAAPLRLDTELGPGLTFDPLALGGGPSAILSPDGHRLAFVARAPGEAARLWVRDLDRLEARPLSGTEGAASPFFSPDGRFIAFFAGGELRKVAVSGGAPVALAAAPNPRGGSWGTNGTIAMLARSAPGVGLVAVAALGGPIETLTTPDPEAGEVTHRWPQWIGEDRLLYTAHGVLADYDEASLVVEVLPNGPREVVHRGGYHGRYLPSGHLVFVHHGTLFAAGFDLERLERTSVPVPVIESVFSTSRGAGAQFSFSDTGTLAYVPGEQFVSSPIHWLTRGGEASLLREEPARWRLPRFSPGGDRLAMVVHDARQSDIWIYDWSRDAFTRLTFDAADDTAPVFSPDGGDVVFSSARGGDGTQNLYRRASGGSGEARRLTGRANFQFASDWHPSGRFLAIQERSPSTGWDVRILEMERDGDGGWRAGAAIGFVETPAVEGAAAFSPDGRFLAYESDESGRTEVYVRPFPAARGKWQVSTAGGRWPTWSRTSPELLYGTEAGEILVARYAAQGDSFRSDPPRPWSEVRFTPPWPAFDLHPDGERVALRLAAEGAGAAPDSVVIVSGFFDELRRLAAGAGTNEP